MTGRGRIELATVRLRLRPCTAADVDALHALWTDPHVRRWLWDDVVIDRATAAERVAASDASFAASGWGLWAAEPREGGALLGVIGLVEIDPAVGPEILYSLHPAHQGRGYATEGSIAVIDHAFEALGFARMPGRTDAPNRASARVLERLGMRFEGETLVHGNPHVCYSIGREEWRRAREGRR
jgi:RimJ/RimL family protein N-acetyltransferase